MTREVDVRRCPTDCVPLTANSFASCLHGAGADAPAGSCPWGITIVRCGACRGPLRSRAAGAARYLAACAAADACAVVAREAGLIGRGWTTPSCEPRPGFHVSGEEPARTAGLPGVLPAANERADQFWQTAGIGALFGQSRSQRGAGRPVPSGSRAPAHEFDT